MTLKDKILNFEVFNNEGFSDTYEWSMSRGGITGERGEVCSRATSLISMSPPLLQADYDAS